ncbi:MAG: peptidase M14 [Pyrinomonadaceae bacterium]|nr:peptidase M14 [Pyrinomonadaceae bacterium]
MSQITDAQTPKEFAEVWEKTHISAKFPSNVRHLDVKRYLKKLEKLGVKVEEVGRSYGNREIFQVEWGKGRTRVFMWSQMHGDEPTATSALMDMFAFLETNRTKKKWVKKLEETLTIRAVPMLNPDGAELFQRRNLQYIDINRDARALETPEGNLLKRLREEFEPDFGFNLHNQQELTTVGKTSNQATISLLAVSGRENGESYPGLERNKRICGVMIKALNQFIKGNIGRYDDSYNPRAFGDMISAWGTPVILVETGGLHGKDEMFLIKLNFIAFLTALQSMVDGTQEKADEEIYENLPFNSSGRLYNYMFRDATVVNYGENYEEFVADVAVNRERRRQETLAPTYVREIGDLSVYKALEEYDMLNYYLVPPNGQLRLGSSSKFLFYKKTRKIDWTEENFAEKHPPDAVFSKGIWIKGKELFVK